MKTLTKVRKVISDALDNNELYCNWSEYKDGVKVFVPIKDEKTVQINIKTEEV